MNPDNISEDQLLSIVVKADTEMFRAGIDIRRRQFEVPFEVMKRMGYTQFIITGKGVPPVLERIKNLFQAIYRKQDVAIGGHLGVFMYRDIFARIAIPTAYGRVRITPMDHVELTDIQKRILSHEPEELEAFHDQFADVWDLEYGKSELTLPYAKLELADRFINLSRLHLHAAAAIVTGGYDYRGAVQSSLLATELALKTGAAAQGFTEKQIKDTFGHDLDALVTFVAGAWPTFDANRVRRVVAQQPKYVPNRYAKAEPKRVEVGHTIMGAQYLAAEVTRQISSRNFRASSTRRGGEDIPHRARKNGCGVIRAKA